MAFLTVPLAAMAQATSLDQVDHTVFLPEINETTIGPALSTVTGNHFVGARPDGTKMLVATATNGLRFEVSLRACTEESETDTKPQPRHCRGILMLSSWDPAPEQNQASLDEAIETFLIENPAINSGKVGQRAPYVARYVIADHGTAQGNLIVEFSNFVRSATEFHNAIAPLYSD